MREHGKAHSIREYIYHVVPNVSFAFLRASCSETSLLFLPNVTY